MAGNAHESVPPIAQKLAESGWLVVTNSMLTSWVVTIAIIIVARLAMKEKKLIPGGLQNFIEFIFESIYNLLEGIMGKHLTKKTFWFFATLFIFIVISNWSALLPLTGNFIAQDVHQKNVSIWRPATADVNMTLAMALVFMFLWVYWSLQEIGPLGMLKHIFAPKGKTSGIMGVIMLLVALAVGVIEVISIGFRPVSLSFRLFGNIYGGENVMHSMALPGVAIPFYFMELMVGLIQGMVFTMLSAVFLALMCSHDEEHHEHEGEHAEAH